jgi:hypothetical protein
MAGKTYLEMATAAIAALKDRTGSSSQAIKAHIVANNKGLDFKQVRLNSVGIGRIRPRNTTSPANAIHFCILHSLFHSEFQTLNDSQRTHSTC